MISDMCNRTVNVACKCIKRVPELPRALMWSILLKVVKVARHWVYFANRERSLYAGIEANIYRGALNVERSRVPSWLLHKSLIREALELNEEYIVIDPICVSDDDRELLDMHSLSLEYIERNRYHSLSSCEVADTSHSSLRAEPDTTFQVAAIEAGRIAAICPWSGAVLQSRKSLLLERNHTIYYYFRSESGSFFLAVGREGKGYVKLYLYFPSIRTVVLLGHRDWTWLGRWELDVFRAATIARWETVSKYINDDAEGVRCLLVDQHHFAHHIWNSLTGLHEMVKNKGAACVDEILVTAEPMGPIDRIFPEVDNRKIRRTSDGEVIRYILEGNRFVVRPGGTIVSSSLADRLCRVAKELLPDDIVDFARAFRKMYWPILWATIRTRNRTWVSQAEGIAQIANTLKRRYSDFALIVDGYGIPWDQDGVTSHQSEMIRQEEAVVERIRSLLDDSIPVHVIVGRPILESVLFSRCIDAYLAHHGSLQNKIAWLSRRPGVVHANKALLAGNKGRLQYHAAFTSMVGVMPPIYLDPEAVVDVPGAIKKDKLRWSDPLDNYDLDYKCASDELVRICESPTRWTDSGC